MWGVRDFSASGTRERCPVASQEGGFPRGTPSPCLTRLALCIMSSVSPTQKLVSGLLVSPRRHSFMKVPELQTNTDWTGLIKRNSFTLTRLKQLQIWCFLNLVRKASDQDFAGETLPFLGQSCCIGETFSPEQGCKLLHLE